MRRTLLAVPFIAVLAFAGCYKSGGSATTAAAPAPAAARGPVTPAGVTPALIAMGDSIFHAGACQRCHGQKGVGANNGPSLVAGPWLHHTGKYEEIVGTITDGIPATEIKEPSHRFPMRPRGGPMNLDDAQVKAVAAYVWSISRDKK